MDGSLPGSSVCGIFNIGIGSHFLLQGVFLDQGSNLCLRHWQVDSLPLSHLGSCDVQQAFNKLLLEEKSTGVVQCGIIFSNLIDLVVIATSFQSSQHDPSKKCKPQLRRMNCYLRAITYAYIIIFIYVCIHNMH